MHGPGAGADNSLTVHSARITRFPNAWPLRPSTSSPMEAKVPDHELRMKVA